MRGALRNNGLETVVQDVRLALRQLRKSPGFTAASVLTVALGIGATTAVFSVVKAVVINALPYRDPERVVALAQSSASALRSPYVGAATVYDWRIRSRVFTSVSVHRDATNVVLINGEPTVLRGQRIDWQFFDTLGVSMQLGRGFLPDEDRPGRDREIVLTHGLWIRLFGGDPNIIGRSIEAQLLGTPVTVVGVLPAGFRPLHMSNPIEWPEYFMPIAIETPPARSCRECQGAYAIARLKHGITPAQAQAELGSVMRNIVHEHPDDYASDTTAEVIPLRDELVGNAQPALWTVFASVVLLLLIACANVANLLLARASQRGQEITVRAALGCGRWRLIRQLLTESLVLAIIGGAAGVLLAWWGVSLFHFVAPRELPRAAEIHVDGSMLLFGFAASLATGLLFGLAPALRASRTDLVEGMKSASRSERSHSRLDKMLVVTQVSLAFFLAMGTGLLAKSFARLAGVDPGFDFHNVLTLTPIVYGPRYPTWEDRVRYFRQMIARVEAIPGVEGAALADEFPFANADPQRIETQGRASPNIVDAPTANRYLISPGYFRVMKIPVKSGRDFTDRDDLRAPAVAILSESCAAALFPSENPIGQSIRVGAPGESRSWATIVGIAGDVRTVLDSRPVPGVYLPQAQNESYYRMVVRTRAEPLTILPAVRVAARETDPTQPIWHILPLEAYIDSSLARRKFTLTLAGMFGALALLLASVGIYGVIAYSVSRRTREIGIRMALGAERHAVLGMVLREMLGLLAWGLAAGFLGTVAISRFLSHLLYEVRPMDAPTLGIAAVVLVVAAVAAAFLPAQRASAIDPAQALRHS